MQLTMEQVNEYENALREAQKWVEKAGRIVCSAEGEAASHAWTRCNSHSEDISDTIHSAYLLRPVGIFNE